MSLYTHWACFDCRKSFHNLPSIKSDTDALKEKRKCPDCGKAMRDMGVSFEPPRRQARKAWAIMQLLSNRGYGFQTEGSKAYIEAFILVTKRPSIESVRRRIDLMNSQEEQSNIIVRLKNYKEQKKKRNRRIDA